MVSVIVPQIGEAGAWWFCRRYCTRHHCFERRRRRRPGLRPTDDRTAIDGTVVREVIAEVLSGDVRRRRVELDEERTWIRGLLRSAHPATDVVVVAVVASDLVVVDDAALLGVVAFAGFRPRSLLSSLAAAARAIPFLHHGLVVRSAEVRTEQTFFLGCGSGRTMTDGGGGGGGRVFSEIFRLLPANPVDRRRTPLPASTMLPRIQNIPWTT